MKRVFSFASILPLLASLTCAMLSVATALAEPTHTIENDFTDKWMLVQESDRENEAEYVKFSERSIEISAKEKSIALFCSKPIVATQHTTVVLTFNVKGTGAGRIGFFSYGDGVWNQTGQEMKALKIEPNEGEQRVTVTPQEGVVVDALRIVIIAEPDSQFEISNLTIGTD